MRKLIDAKQRDISLKKIGITVLFELLIFQSVFLQFWDKLNYIDEVFAIMVFSYGIGGWLYRGKRHIKQETALIILALFIFNLFGWMSSMVSGYRTFAISVLSCFISNKYYFVLLAVMAISKHENERNNASILYDKYFARLIRVNVVLTVIWHLFSLYFKDNMFGSNEICAKLVFLVALCFMTWRGKKDRIYLLISFAGLLTSDSMKGYGATVIMLLIWFWCINRKKKIKLSEVIIGVGMTCAVAWCEIKYYIIDGIANCAPRALLLVYGAVVANDRFPLGTGWGTFASHYAAKQYSPVYVELGWKAHFTVGQNKWFYLNDIFWPTLYTESGWIGFVGYMIVLIVMFYLVQKQYNVNHKVYAAGILVYAYMMVTTLESTAFSHPAMIVLAIVLGMVIVNKERAVHGQN